MRIIRTVRAGRMNDVRKVEADLQVLSFVEI